MTTPFKVDVRWPATQSLSDRTTTTDPAAALTAYRALLNRADLAGQPCAARLVVGGRSLFYSEFDKPIGRGRIHPDAPLSLAVDKAGADALAAWTPRAARGGQGGPEGSARAAAAGVGGLHQDGGDLGRFLDATGWGVVDADGYRVGSIAAGAEFAAWCADPANRSS